MIGAHATVLSATQAENALTISGKQVVVEIAQPLAIQETLAESELQERSKTDLRPQERPKRTKRTNTVKDPPIAEADQLGTLLED